MQPSDLNVTVWFVGDEVGDALETFPFDSAESAEEYRKNNNMESVWSATAYVDLTTVEKV